MEKARVVGHEISLLVAYARKQRSVPDLDCQPSRRSEKINTMKFNKNIGMLLLAVYLIFEGLLGFGLNIGPAIFILYLIALAAGVFILIGK